MDRDWNNGWIGKSIKFCAKLCKKKRIVLGRKSNEMDGIV